MFQCLYTALCCSCQVTGITTAAARAAPLWQLLCPPGGCAAGGPGAASWAAACAVMAGHRREFMLPGLTIRGRPELGAFTLRFRCEIAVSIHKDSISYLTDSLGPTIHGRPELGALHVALQVHYRSSAPELRCLSRDTGCAASPRCAVLLRLICV